MSGTNDYTQNFIAEVKGALNRYSSTNVDILNVENGQRMVIVDKDDDTMMIEETTDAEIDAIIAGTYINKEE